MAGSYPSGPLDHAALGRLPLLGTASAHEMVRLAREHGLAAHRSLRDTGISPTLLDDAAGTIAVRQELALGGNLVRDLSAVPGLGLTIGNRYRLTMYGVWGLALLSAPTPREAVGFGLRFVDLSYACSRISAAEEDGELSIMIEAPGLPEGLREFFEERSLSAVVRLLDDLMPGRRWLRWVSVRRPRPEDPEVYHRTFGVPVSFDRPVNELRVDARALDQPQPLANELTLRLMEQQCRELLTRRSVRLTQTDLVREYVLAHLAQGPDMAGATAALGVSERTLRRRLTEEGTSFSAILDGVRRSLAEDLLRQGMPASHVGRRLGYTEPAAFTHAFKRWTGFAPRAFGSAPAEGAPAATEGAPPTGADGAGRPPADGADRAPAGAPRTPPPAAERPGGPDVTTRSAGPSPGTRRPRRPR